MSIEENDEVSEAISDFLKLIEINYLYSHGKEVRRKASCKSRVRGAFTSYKLSFLPVALSGEERSRSFAFNRLISGLKLIFAMVTE